MYLHLARGLLVNGIVNSIGERNIGDIRFVVFLNDANVESFLLF